jgi:NAD(P)-dependent dehydrogenase (short-subunit alcohol dehydrogenase family)
MAKVKDGKVCLITGATSGVGKAVARDLAEMGVIVVGVGCDKIRCTEANREIRISSGNERVEFLVTDLSNVDQVRGLAQEFKDKYEKLDVLINNAGAYFLRRELNPQGFEITWALNQLSYFLLTCYYLNKLLPVHQ